MSASAPTLVAEFAGPYSWLGTAGAPSIVDVDAGRKAGIYLWTVRLLDGELIYYVGQTGRSFSQRMLEHFREHMSGGYHLYEPAEFSHGRKVLLWPGRYGPDRQPSVASFMRQFQDLAPTMVNLAHLYRFFLASVEFDTRLRERFEAALASHLRAQPGMVGAFQDTGIAYHPRAILEEPIRVSIRCTARLLGVPESLSI